MGHLQDMTREQRSDFLTHKYKRNKEERKGNSFEWFNQEKHDNLIENKGYKWYEFEIEKGKIHTTCQITAKCMVDKLRSDGNFARIVCGMEQCIQRIKSFSVIYKPKK